MTSEMECSASNKLGCEVLELEEGTEGAALDCSSSALPPADITWIKGGQEVAKGGQFVFPDPLHRFEKGKQMLTWKPDHYQEHTFPFQGFSRRLYLPGFQRPRNRGDHNDLLRHLSPILHCHTLG